MKTLGVIGGMGPLAGAHFIERLAMKTKAGKDQDHIPTILINQSAIPDRTDYILDHTKENPLPGLIQAAKMLEVAGVSAFCTICVTSHFFEKELKTAISVPFISMIDETVKELQKQRVGAVGILATTGTIKTGLWESRCEKIGVRCFSPEPEEQQTVMKIIYEDIKAGYIRKEPELTRVISHLQEKGAQKILLGCTELPLIAPFLPFDSMIDPLEILAQRVIQLFGKEMQS